MNVRVRVGVRARGRLFIRVKVGLRARDGLSPADDGSTEEGKGPSLRMGRVSIRVALMVTTTVEVSVDSLCEQLSVSG